METNVMISVKGEQYYEGADPDATELLSEGRLERSGEGWLLSYEESALTGMEGTTTEFEMAGERVILRRRGTVNTEMVFCRGEISTTAYETPYGALSVEIATAALRWTLSEQGGEIYIRYSIAVEHQITGENQFHIQVKEMRPGGEMI